MDGQETIVWRFADYSDAGMITFNIAVFQKGGHGQWTVQVQSTPQRPWQSAELAHLVGEAGFTEVALYGSLAGEPYGAGVSGDLVLAAKKRD